MPLLIPLIKYYLKKRHPTRTIVIYKRNAFNFNNLEILHRNHLIFI